jgi:hypothetical protein
MDIDFPPNDWSAADQKVIERVARTCPVRVSLNPEIKIIELYNFDATEMPI